MCFKRWFHKPDPVPTEPANKRILLFAINDYPGSANDLSGCLNDIDDVEKMLNAAFPGFNILKFKDSQVTRKAFIDNITSAISLLRPGDELAVWYSGHGTYTYDKNGDEQDGYDEAVYLYDGMVIDDDIGAALKNIPDGATVLLCFDSCFSGTVTRNPHKNRFIDPGLPRREKKRVRFNKAEMNYIVISGCGEHQTSADAYIDGRYNGAFTYFALKTLAPGITYNQWIGRIHQYLPSKDFDQNPTIEGNSILLNKKVFT